MYAHLTQAVALERTNHDVHLATQSRRSAVKKAASGSRRFPWPRRADRVALRRPANGDFGPARA